MDVCVLSIRASTLRLYSNRKDVLIVDEVCVRDDGSQRLSLGLPFANARAAHCGYATANVLMFLWLSCKNCLT